MIDSRLRQSMSRFLSHASSRRWRVILFPSLFAFGALAIIGVVHSLLACTVVIGSLGGSAVVAFGMPGSEMARPRSLLGGHAVSCLVGVFIWLVPEHSPWTEALAVGAALAAMLATDTVHSPAGGDPLFILASNGAWGRPLFVLLFGLILIAAFARVSHAVTCPPVPAPRSPKDPCPPS
jgi:CBS-domain-containing membrane protein